MRMDKTRRFIMIEVCIGSACHLKGSYEVIQQLKQLIQEHDMEDTVELKSAFCLGVCGGGVSIRINEKDVLSITPEETSEFFERYVTGEWR